MAKDWRSAYFQQARSDYDVFLLLNQVNVPLCHRLHYLQMTTEKLAKGFLTPPGGVRYEKTHNALVRFMRVARERRDIREACQFSSKQQFSAYVQNLLEIAREVENLSPEGEDHPNPEYPWEVLRTIFVPTEYPFANLDLTSPKMDKLLDFVQACFQMVKRETDA